MVVIANVETTVPILLGVLCSTYMPPRQHLETQQALFKQFAEIIDFTLKFDDLKVTPTVALLFYLAYYYPHCFEIKKKYSSMWS